MTRIRERVTLTVLEPKQVGQGWLVRVRVRNDGRPADFEASVVSVNGDEAHSDGLPRRLRWRNSSAGPVHLATGGSEFVRLAICRPQPGDVVLLSASADGERERRVAIPAQTPVCVTVRVSQGSKVVAEQQVRVGFELHGESLQPVMAMTSGIDTPPLSKSPSPTLSTAIQDDRIAEEAQRFGDQNNQAYRGTSWMAIPYVRKQVVRLFDLPGYVARHLSDHPHPVALTLACGDMSGEYGLFKRVGVAEIDASDISEGQRAKFFERYDGKIPVNYTIGDANEIELEAERYDLVYLQHAYHHVEALEHVAGEIAKSLKPDGIFAISDYIGANFLQRTPRQRDLGGAIWRALPERYRIGRNGRVVPNLHIPSKASLPPYEAVRSEEILEVLSAHFDIREFVSFGALLMPLFNGFVHCYTDSAEDQEFIRTMWDLDQWLIKTGAVEPNFMKAILVPKPLMPT
jgi:SAM-dependent methyltransferase